MRWLVFTIFALIMLALEVGLRTMFEPLKAVPSFTLVLAVYVALCAPPAASGWACLILGLLVDLATPQLVRSSPEAFAIVGPTALGFLAGGYLVVQGRGWVFRDSPWSLAVMVLAAGILAQAVIVSLLLMRGWVTGDPIANWGAGRALGRGLLAVLYSAILAVPAGFVLIRTTRWWGFVAPERRGAWRAGV
jgi:rod shape-determining protein MreD